ncbi:MAG: hypothetical protein ACM336_01940 [Acidobacteriota bacterium]|nr:hypothetical protein [Bryobacteraceae bacterium]
MRWIACAFVAVLALQAASNRGDRAEYIGGTLADLPKAGGYIDVTGEECFRFQTGRTFVEVPYSNINILEYGQKVDRRYIMAIAISPLLLLSKKRAHFLTIGYEDADGRQQALVFRVEKGHIRAVLVSLEAKTGRKVEYQDTEARKAGAS